MKCQRVKVGPTAIQSSMDDSLQMLQLFRIELHLHTCIVKYVKNENLIIFSITLLLLGTLTFVIEQTYLNDNFMNTLKYTGAMVAIISVVQLLTACSGYIVSAPPQQMDEVVLVAPSPIHVWIPGYYSYNNGSYVFVNGYYRIPPHGRTSYVQGSWQNTPRGYKRGKGHWR